MNLVDKIKGFSSSVSAKDISKKAVNLMMVPVAYFVIDKAVNDYSPNVNSGNLYAAEASVKPQQHVAEMYNWDGVCTKAENYDAKVPSATESAIRIDAKFFFNLYNNVGEFQAVLDNEGLSSAIYNLKIGTKDSLTSAYFTSDDIILRVETPNEKYSNMDVKGKNIHYVYKQLDEKKLNILRNHIK